MSRKAVSAEQPAIFAYLDVVRFPSNPSSSLLIICLSLVYSALAYALPYACFQ